MELLGKVHVPQTLHDSMYLVTVHMSYVMAILECTDISRDISLNNH